MVETRGAQGEKLGPNLPKPLQHLEVGGVAHKQAHCPAAIGQYAGAAAEPGIQENQIVAAGVGFDELSLLKTAGAKNRYFHFWGEWR